MNKLYTFFLFLLIFNEINAVSKDWPMWRYDYKRSASTPEQLADQLYLQWYATYSPRIPVWDDPLNRDLMPYDRLFEPVVAGNKIFLGFNDHNKVVALDLNSGRELWHFYTDGPVRLPPAINKDKIYFTGDDGYCYCLKTLDGRMVWKRLLAPAENKLLGNKRLISIWPARGGVVIKNDIIYAAASIFPLMGTFIYALDADTGKIIWKNESTGSNYILQPHRSPAFADVAPQGAFTISGNKLLAAGGRSVPAAFNLTTGEELYYHLAANQKTGGSFTCASDRVFFNHYRGRMVNMYDSDTGSKLVSEAGEYPVIDGERFYFSGEKVWMGQRGSGNKLDTLWICDYAAGNDLIKAGDCLFAADSTGIKSIKLLPGNETEVIWSYNTNKNVERLIAANGKLIAITSDGSILVFGDSPPENIMTYHRNGISSKKIRTSKIIRKTGITDGYGLIIGTGSIRILNQLIYGTSLYIIVCEKDQDRIRRLRKYYDKAGVSSERISFLPFGDKLPALPKYFSSLTLINNPSFLSHNEKDNLKLLFESTRPYGGMVLIRRAGRKSNRFSEIVNESNFPGATLELEKGYAIITRNGPLEGAAPWTHNYGDIANTVKSNDRLVKAPLGILWFGGNSNLDVLPRHGHGPGEQVIDGKLIIQGINTISARDVYTGRVLWRHEFENLKNDNWMVYYDDTYDEENPLDTKYNQVHLPGSNARGTNFIATKEYVYLIDGNACNLIDINTGEIVKVFTAGNDCCKLGYIGVYKDLLILGKNFAQFPGMENDSVRIKNPKFTNYDLSASNELMILDRFNGKILWTIKANHGFIHNSIIAGDNTIFCLDKLPQYLETKLKRRGLDPPEDSRLLYLNPYTGEIIHIETTDIFGTWLGYSETYKLLLQATRPSRDMLHGEEGNRMIAYNIRTKEKIWDKAINYANPPIIHNNKIYTEGEGFYLLTGEPLTETDPVTGEELKWSFKREYGCGIVAASEHLLTFRSASAGFVNLDAFEGTGSLGGWKASCSTNLIAADGVLNSPDYTRTCQCAYQNQTSLALINMPWMSYWTNSNYSWNGKRICKLGLNLNAPGDRSADNDILWFEYPWVAGTPPGIPVEIDTVKFKRIRKEPVSITSENTPWISSSALEGIRSIIITLTGDQIVPESAYTVTLYFAELENKNPGDRIFDISIQGKQVADHFDIVKEAGKPDMEIVKSFPGIKAGKTIRVDLTPEYGNTLISGIELVQEKPQ